MIGLIERAGELGGQIVGKNKPSTRVKSFWAPTLSGREWFLIGTAATFGAAAGYTASKRLEGIKPLAVIREVPKRLAEAPTALPITIRNFKEFVAARANIKAETQEDIPLEGAVAN